MTDKELKDWCKTCNVEPPAMKFKCPECEHNPDKEQIINDVDVSGCEHLTEIRGCWLSTCDYLKYKGNITSKVCKYNPNCYFKQLARKEQECEKAKQNAQDTYALWRALIESFSILQGEKIKLEQECEEIKEKYEALKLENQEGYEIVAELKHECEELKESNDRYHKALEEIEKYAKENDEMLQGYHHEWANNRQILEIINKAKGGEDE